MINTEVPTFTLLWTNNDTNKDKLMQEHRFQIRDLLPIDSEYGILWDLYLDQLVVTYYDPTTLSYVSPDTSTTVYHTEECLVGFGPCGAQHVLYVEDPTGAGTGPDAWNLYTPLKYSLAASVVPGLSSSECRVYRPIRDAAIAQALPIVQGCMPPIVIELMWPLLGDTNFKLPNYRIKQVLCNFSCRRR